MDPEVEQHMNGRSIRWWKPEIEPHTVETLSFIKCACVLSHFSRVRLFATLWTVAHQVSLSMGFSRQEHWSSLPFLVPGELPDPGTEPESPAAPVLQADSFLLSHHGRPQLPQEFSLKFQTL